MGQEDRKEVSKQGGKDEIYPSNPLRNSDTRSYLRFLRYWLAQPAEETRDEARSRRRLLVAFLLGVIIGQSEVGILGLGLLFAPIT